MHLSFNVFYLKDFIHPNNYCIIQFIPYGIQIITKKRYLQNNNPQTKQMHQQLLDHF